MYRGINSTCMCTLIPNSVQDLDPSNEELSQPMYPATAPGPLEPSPKRRRRGSNNEVDDALLLLSRSAIERQIMQDKKEAEKNAPPPNPETNYGLEIAETLHRFTPRQRALAKLRIQQVLLEVEFPDEAYSGAVP